VDWELDEAKMRLGELVTRALTEGPQRVRRGDQAVVVLSEADYRRLTGERITLKDYLLGGPDLSDLDLARDPSPMREWRAGG
jgi:prevent-host-death family protein